PDISNAGTLTYTPAPDANGVATVRVRAKDDGGTANGGQDTSPAQTFTITVTAVDDAPVNAVPGPQTTDEDTALVFSSANGNPVSVADVDAGAQDVQVTLAVTHGTLTLNGTGGLAFSVGTGAHDATMTFTGPLSAINPALDGLTYEPDANYNGGD